MTEVKGVGRSLRWCHLFVTLGLHILRCRLWNSITRCSVAWSQFMEITFILTFHLLPNSSRVNVCNSGVSSAMRHASETWAPTVSDLHRLQRNGRAMTRCMWGVIPKGPSQFARPPGDDATWWPVLSCLVLFCLGLSCILQTPRRDIAQKGVRRLVAGGG